MTEPFRCKKAEDKTMTCRHFKRFAQALVAFRRSDGAMLTADQFTALIDQIALACGDFNPKFDYDEFFIASHDGVWTAPQEAQNA